MEGAVVSGLVLVLLVQVPLWLVVERDARRIGLNPHVWGYAVLVPLVGFVAVLAYLYERNHAIEG